MENGSAAKCLVIFCVKLLQFLFRLTKQYYFSSTEFIDLHLFQHLIIDYNVSIAGGWEPWVNKVPSMEIEAHRVAATDIVVPTMVSSFTLYAL